MVIIGTGLEGPSGATSVSASEHETDNITHTLRGNMESQSKITTPCSNCSKVAAQFAMVVPARITSLPTTITLQVKCVACSALVAIKSLEISETPSQGFLGLQII